MSDKNTQSSGEQPQLPRGYNPSKGAPTPRRKDQQRARRHPLVADTRKMTRAEKKALKAERRVKSNELYQRQQTAMKTGDIRNMPAQHQGKERAWGRDYVDATGPVSAFFMPLALALFPIMFLQLRWPQAFVPIVWFIYGLFVIMLIHAWVTARRAKVLAEYIFGSTPRGFMTQMLGRAFYLRRWRLPSPQVGRGEFPDGASKENLKAARKARKKNKKK